MATRTIANGGGNWSSTGTWVEGVVPVLGDAVVATATSGQLTVDITTAACTSIDFTNYTNTFTISSGQQLAVSGTVKFVAGMTSAGTGTLRVLATSTLTSGGITFAGTLSLGGTSQTYTLGDAWIVSGGLIFNGTTAVSLTGAFNISVAGGLTMTTTSTGTVSATIILNGTGTWSGTAALRNNLTINTAGTITVSGNVRYDTGTLTYTAGTVTTTGSNLIVATTATLNTNGISWNDVTLSGNGTNITLTSNMLVTKLLTLGTSTAAFNINGAFTITCDNSAGSGGITFSGTTSQTNGTASIKMTDGTYTGVSSCRLGLNLELDGNITISSAAAMIYQAGTLKYTSGTITVTGTTLSLFNGGTLDTSGMTWNNVSFIGTSQTYTLSSDLNLSGNLSLSGTTTTTINGLFNINVSGNLTTTTAASTSGTTTIVLNGTGIWSNSSTGILTNNLTINSLSGTITISGTVRYQSGILTYTAGTVVTTGSTLTTQFTTTFNTNGSSLSGATTTSTTGINWDNVTISTANTITNNSNFTILGTLSIISGNPTLNGSTIYLGGSLTATTSPTGTSAFIMNGTGTWSGSGAVRNNLTINTSGTITVSGTVAYNTGTLTYTAGTVTTTGSTLSCTASTTFNTAGITWNNFSSSSSANRTITMSSNLSITGTLTINNNNCAITFAGPGLLVTSGALTIIGNSGNTSTTTLSNNITVTNFTSSFGTAETNNVINGFNIDVTGNLSINSTTTGTTTIVLTGTGTWSGSSLLYNNLTFNTSGTITISGTVSVASSNVSTTITYTAGSVTATGSIIRLFRGGAAGIIFNTSGMTWGSLQIYGYNQSGGVNVLTLTSNLNIGATLQTVTQGLNGNKAQIDGAFNANVGGNITLGAQLAGSATIVMNGTGTYSASFYLFNNLTFNTTGTITISGFLYYQSNTITYIAGTIITTGSTLYVAISNANRITLNTSGMVWDNVSFIDGNTSGGASVFLLSNFNCIGTTTIQLNNTQNVVFSVGLFIFNPTGTLNISLDNIPFINASITLPNEITVKNCNLTNNHSLSSLTINSQKIKVLGGTFTPSGAGVILGTTEIVLDSNSTWSQGASVTLRNNITFNSKSGPATVSGTITYNTGTITYASGTVTTKNSTLNLTGATTLINCHRIPFNIVTITSGVTITMNEFFTGTPAAKTTIQPSSTTNYTITFQDNFEKFARNVKVSRATLSRPNQLTVITDKGNKGNNVGIKFYSNQMPNGFAKNNPATPTQTTYLPGGLVTDPCFV